MNTRVQKWGNSLALRIPHAFARDARIEQGSEVDISLENGKLVIAPVPETRVTLSSLLEGVTPENRHDAVDAGPAMGNEAL